jgi:hypothetical protein
VQNNRSYGGRVKPVCLLGTLFLCGIGNTATRVQFLPMESVFIGITEKDVYGNADTDAVDLYDTMNVTEQDGSMGKGKSIKTEAKDFTLVCAKEKKTCSIILRKSERTDIAADRNYAAIRFSGDAAAEMTSKFKLNENHEVFFQSYDKTFRVIGNQESFLFEYSNP